MGYCSKNSSMPSGAAGGKTGNFICKKVSNSNNVSVTYGSAGIFSFSTTFLPKVRANKISKSIVLLFFFLFWSVRSRPICSSIWLNCSFSSFSVLEEYKQRVQLRNCPPATPPDGSVFITRLRWIWGDRANKWGKTATILTSGWILLPTLTKYWYIV